MHDGKLCTSASGTSLDCILVRTQHWLHATKQNLTVHLLAAVHLTIEKGM